MKLLEKITGRKSAGDTTLRATATYAIRKRTSRSRARHSDTEPGVLFEEGLRRTWAWYSQSYTKS